MCGASEKWTRGGEVVKGIKKAPLREQVSLRLPCELLDWARGEAVRNGLSLNAFLLGLINDAFYSSGRMISPCLDS